MTPRRSDPILPKWLKWLLAIATAIVTIGAALLMLGTGYAKAEPYIPATRGAVKIIKDTNDADHASIRGSIRQMQTQDRAERRALLCGLVPLQARKLGLDCD